VTIRFVRHQDLRLTELDEEGIALHLEQRKYYSLSGTGLTILRALKTPRTEEELVQDLMARYDVTVDEAGRSVRTFLEECQDAGLVVPAPGLAVD